jgi:hypothetical protein
MHWHGGSFIKFIVFEKDSNRQAAGGIMQGRGEFGAVEKVLYPG